MNKKGLKKLMTEVAKGKISMEEAQEIINEEKTHQDKPELKIKGKRSGDDPKKHIRKRKKVLKNKEESK